MQFRDLRRNSKVICGKIRAFDWILGIFRLVKS